MTKKVWFKNPRGQKLAGILHIPKKFKGKRPAGVVLGHGYNSDKNNPLIKEMALSLEKAGFKVLRFDLSGYGQSEGDRKKGTYTSHRKDIKSAVNFLAKHGVIRLGVIGHSMSGSVMIQEKIRDHLIHCMGLVAPVVFPRWTHYDRLSKKEKKFINDNGYYITRTGGTVYQPFFKDLKNQAVLDASRKIINPVIIYAARKDHAIPIKHQRLLFKNILSEVKFLKVLDADHRFTKPAYRQKINKDIVYWFSKYLHYHPSVINAFVQHKGKLLLLKRSQEVGTHRGMWNCVGGYIKSDLQSNGELKVKESPVKRARHEIEEELGIKKEDLKLIDQAEPVDWVDDTSDKTWRIHYFLFESKTNKVKLDWEHTEFRWVKPNQIKKYKNIIGLEPNLKRLMKKIK